MQPGNDMRGFPPWSPLSGLHSLSGNSMLLCAGALGSLKHRGALWEDLALTCLHPTRPFTYLSRNSSEDCCTPCPACQNWHKYNIFRLDCTAWRSRDQLSASYFMKNKRNVRGWVRVFWNFNPSRSSIIISHLMTDNKTLHALFQTSKLQLAGHINHFHMIWKQLSAAHLSDIVAANDAKDVLSALKFFPFPSTLLECPKSSLKAW